MNISYKFAMREDSEREQELNVYQDTNWSERDKRAAQATICGVTIPLP
jgi:hypothetical protein